MSPTVVVVGGGYGGAAAAKALDDVTDVILIEPRDAFLHNVAALRALVRPDVVPRIFLPYDRLLKRGSLIRDRVIQADGDHLLLASGEQLSPEYTVLATGSGYPFPAKTDVDETAAAQDRYRATQRELAAAEHVLLLGAGPVGLELAGEIRAEWPHKRVTIVDPLPDILAGYGSELSDEIRRQLGEMGVSLLLGSPLTREPPGSPGTAQPFTVATQAGVTIEADIWFRCYGATPVTGYLTSSLAEARTPHGLVRVLPTLQVEGHAKVFALGDITNVPEVKRAAPAMRHASVIAENIGALIAGRDSLARYQPGLEGILIPLGPAGGASLLPGRGLLGADATAQYKGADMMVGRFTEMFGLPGRPRPAPGSEAAVPGRPPAQVPP